MEKLTDNNERKEQVSFFEKKKDLAQKLEKIHSEYVAFGPFGNEWADIEHRYRQESGTFDVRETKKIMSPKDLARMEELEKQEEALRRKIGDLILESFELIRNVDISQWKRIPERGVKGSYAEQYRREYRTPIDESYSFQLMRSDVPQNYPRMEHPSGKHATGYSLSIQGKKNIEIESAGGFKAKTKKLFEFPYLDNNTVDITVDDEGGRFKEDDEAEPNVFSQLDLFLSKEKKDELAKECITLGENLKEKLG